MPLDTEQTNLKAKLNEVPKVDGKTRPVQSRNLFHNLLHAEVLGKVIALQTAEDLNKGDPVCPRLVREHAERPVHD